jgi:hypothetical protein
MKWRNTILLALVAIVAVALAYRDVTSEDPAAGWNAIFEEPPPTRHVDNIERLVDFDPKSVTAITVEGSGRTARTTRKAYGWSHTTSPRAITDLLESLADLAIILHIDEAPSDEDLDGYGLVVPRAAVRLERSGAPAISITLGSHNPSTTGIYARASQRPGVVLTGAVAMWEIEMALNALNASPTP